MARTAQPPTRASPGHANLYGTTPGGGASGWGTIFKVPPSGALTRRYNFCSQCGCTDGNEPSAGLVQATNGGLQRDPMEL